MANTENLANFTNNSTEPMEIFFHERIHDESTIKQNKNTCSDDNSLSIT